MKITRDDVIDVHSAKAWSMSLFGTPKVTIVCGKCLYSWATRDVITITNWGNRIVATCPACLQINYTGLVRN